MASYRLFRSDSPNEFSVFPEYWKKLRAELRSLPAMNADGFVELAERTSFFTGSLLRMGKGALDFVTGNLAQREKPSIPDVLYALAGRRTPSS